MPRQFISKDLLIEEAYKIAENDGLSSLSVRKLATACNMSVGSLYSYFPTKANLITAVIKKLYTKAFFDDFCIINEEESFISYLRRLHASLMEVVDVYQNNWLSEIHKLSYQERALGKQAEDKLFEHMEKGLMTVLSTDPFVDKAKLTGALEPAKLCAFVLNNLLAAVRDGKDCETLFALLEQTLYTNCDRQQ